MALKSCIFSIILIQLYAVSVGGIFRFDYEFNPHIDGWLKLHVIPATWRDARLRCDLEGSVLASPINLNIKLTLDRFWKEKNVKKCGYYTGVNALFSKGDYFSVEGVSLARMPVEWAFGEPDNADNNEDCIISINGTIADVNCTEEFPYICYRKKTKDMVMTSCGTVDKEYKLEPLTGNCYKFHGRGTNWSRAFMTCAAEGGYLAILNSPEEATLIKNLYDANYDHISAGSNKEVLQLGFQDSDEHGFWRTVDGVNIEDAGYAVWKQGQPDNANNNQHCGAMFRDAQLDDYYCNGRAAFVCEKSPYSLFEP